MASTVIDGSGFQRDEQRHLADLRVADSDEDSVGNEPRAAPNAATPPPAVEASHDMTADESVEFNVDQSSVVFHDDDDAHPHADNHATPEQDASATLRPSFGRTDGELTPTPAGNTSTKPPMVPDPSPTPSSVLFQYDGTPEPVPVATHGHRQQEQQQYDRPHAEAEEEHYDQPDAVTEDDGGHHHGDEGGVDVSPIQPVAKSREQYNAHAEEGQTVSQQPARQQAARQPQPQEQQPDEVVVAEQEDDNDEARRIKAMQRQQEYASRQALEDQPHMEQWFRNSIDDSAPARSLAAESAQEPQTQKASAAASRRVSDAHFEESLRRSSLARTASGATESTASPTRGPRRTSFSPSRAERIFGMKGIYDDEEGHEGVAITPQEEEVVVEDSVDENGNEIPEDDTAWYNSDKKKKSNKKKVTVGEKTLVMEEHDPNDPIVAGDPYDENAKPEEEKGIVNSPQVKELRRRREALDEERRVKEREKALAKRMADNGPWEEVGNKKTLIPGRHRIAPDAIQHENSKRLLANNMRGRVADRSEDVAAVHINQGASRAYAYPLWKQPEAETKYRDVNKAKAAIKKAEEEEGNGLELEQESKLPFQSEEEARMEALKAAAVGHTSPRAVDYNTAVRQRNALRYGIRATAGKGKLPEEMQSPVYSRSASRHGSASRSGRTSPMPNDQSRASSRGASRRQSTEVARPINRPAPAQRGPSPVSRTIEILPAVPAERPRSATPQGERSSSLATQEVARELRMTPQPQGQQVSSQRQQQRTAHRDPNMNHIDNWMETQGVPQPANLPQPNRQQQRRARQPRPGQRGHMVSLSPPTSDDDGERRGQQEPEVVPPAGRAYDRQATRGPSNDIDEFRSCRGSSAGYSRNHSTAVGITNNRQSGASRQREVEDGAEETVAHHPVHGEEERYDDEDGSSGIPDESEDLSVYPSPETNHRGFTWRSPTFEKDVRPTQGMMTVPDAGPRLERAPSDASGDTKLLSLHLRGGPADRARAIRDIELQEAMDIERAKQEFIFGKELGSRRFQQMLDTRIYDLNEAHRTGSPSVSRRPSNARSSTPPAWERLHNLSKYEHTPRGLDSRTGSRASSRGTSPVTRSVNNTGSARSRTPTGAAAQPKARRSSSVGSRGSVGSNGSVYDSLYQRGMDQVKRQQNRQAAAAEKLRQDEDREIRRGRAFAQLLRRSDGHRCYTEAELKKKLFKMEQEAPDLLQDKVMTRSEAEKSGRTMHVKGAKKPVKAYEEECKKREEAEAASYPYKPKLSKLAQEIGKKTSDQMYMVAHQHQRAKEKRREDLEHTLHERLFKEKCEANYHFMLQTQRDPSIKERFIRDLKKASKKETRLQQW